MALMREKRKSFSRGKKVLIAVNVAVMVFVAAGIFLGLCHLASLPAFRFRIDLTGERSFTLSPMTIDLLESLEKEVKVISIFHRPDPRDMTGMSMAEKRVGNYANMLLQEYVVQSGGTIKLEVLDRDRDNLRVGELNEKIGLMSDNVIIFLSEGHRKDIYPSDMATIDRGGVDPTTNIIHLADVKSYNVEAAVTSAILSVMEKTRPKAYFTTGRREAGLHVEGADGLSIAAKVLGFLNFEVEEVKLFAEPVVPEDCSVLVIPGPMDDFGPEEIAAVREYMQSKGRLFLALSPRSGTGPEEILADFDISLNRAVTCRERRVSVENLLHKSLIPVQGFDEESRVTRSIARASGYGLFFYSGAVNRSADDPDVKEIVWSPKDCWGDAHEPGKDGNFFYDSANEEMGPRVLGVSCEGSGAVEGARMIFFADTYFYTNDSTNNYPANLDLFKNSLNWLAAREYLLDIPPKTPEVSRVDLMEDEYHRIGFYVLFFIPALAVFLGIAVWWLRRR